MASKLAFLGPEFSVTATPSIRYRTHKELLLRALRYGGIVEHIRERIRALGVDYDHPLPRSSGNWNEITADLSPEAFVETLAPFRQFLHAAHLFDNAGVPPFALSIPLAGAAAEKVYWTRDQQRPVARGLIELYLECWQALDGLWEEYERQDAICYDTSNTDEVRYAAWSELLLLRTGRVLNAERTSSVRDNPAYLRRVAQELERVRGLTDPPDTDLAAVKGWLCDHLRHRFRERMEWVTDGIEVGRNTAQEDTLRSMASTVQNGLRTVRLATTAARARALYALARTELDALGVAGAPTFSRTNGTILAPNQQGQRIVTIAPNVKAVRLRVENPGLNQGVIEVDAGGDTEEVTQSIGATASNRATWRCTFTSADPLTAGDHLVRVSVRNDIGPAAVDLLVRVTDTAPAFDAARRGAQTFTAGTAARFRFGKATGGNGALTYAMDAVPEGMAFDAGTRTLSGTPSGAAQATDYTCTATDADGDEATQVVSIEVASGGSGGPAVILGEARALIRVFGVAGGERPALRELDPPARGSPDRSANGRRTGAVIP